MKTFKSYVTIHGKSSNKIILFDVDDTLINTTAGIRIKKNNKYIKRLTNKEYNDYVLKPGEELDFAEFEDSELLSKESFTKYWKTLKKEYHKGTHIGIITARGSIEMIYNFLLDNGIDIKKELIFATDDPKLGLSGSVQQRKAEVISILYNYGYKNFIFFDDNDGNLKAVKSIENILPIKVVTIKA